MSFSIHDIQFYGDRICTIVTASASAVDGWIKYILNTYSDKQHQKLIVGRSCLIFQLYHSDDILQSLIDFLGDEKFLFVSKEVRNDAYKLFEDYELQVGHAKDLAYWAAAKYRDKELRKLGLRGLVIEFLHLKVLKKPQEITTSEWNVRVLSSDQIEFLHLKVLNNLIGVSLSKPRPDHDCLQLSRNFVDVHSY